MIKDRVLILLSKDDKKLLMQWKGPFAEVEKIAEVNVYSIKVENKQTFYANMLKKYVERRTKSKGKENDFDGVVGSVLSVAAARINERNENGADEAIDEDSLLELGMTQPKETVADITFGSQLNTEPKTQLQKLISMFKHIYRLTRK